VPAGRLQVDEQRHAGPGPVEVVQRQVDPEPPGDGEQVHDRVRGSADRRKRDDRVEKRATGQHRTRTAALGH